MKRLLGRWVCPLLLRRPFSSAFSDCYHLAYLPLPRLAFHLDVPKIAEIQVLLGLTLVIYRDLTRPVAQHLHATNA